LNIEAVFVRSAANARDLPCGDLPELALVGRSNVGKSSLINALVRRRLARTSAAPGKTRLANVYRVRRGAGAPFYLVDLPGYGYARGDRAELDAATRAYFGRVGPVGRVSRVGSTGKIPPDPQDLRDPRGRRFAALLLVDARHPGLRSDVEAWHWLVSTVDRATIVATKIDKLSRAERLRAAKTNEAAFEHPVLPFSADTGEGLEDLWKLIEHLTKSA